LNKEEGMNKTIVINGRSYDLTYLERERDYGKFIKIGGYNQ